MRTQCLIIEPDRLWQSRIQTVLLEKKCDYHTVSDLHQAILCLNSQQPNIVFLRCGLLGMPHEPILKILNQFTHPCCLVILIEQTSLERFTHLVKSESLSDILTENAGIDRIQQAVDKTLDRLAGALGQSRYFRGFMGFVGVTPSLRERKILTQYNVGVLHNRSMRMAIEYWRKNPESQMVLVALNTHEVFSTRCEETLEFWQSCNMLPWEIALYEAQKHYYSYWREPIEAGLLPSVIPAMVRTGGDQLTVVDPVELLKILKKVEESSKQGDVHRLMSVLGVSFRDQDMQAKDSSLAQLVLQLEQKMKEVDLRYPHLTRLRVKPTVENAEEGEELMSNRTPKNRRRRMAVVEKLS